VLVDYLHASTATKHFLEVLCHNARLSAAAGKVFDQLVETKVALTEAEEKLSLLNDAMHRKDALLKEAGIADNDWDSRTLDEANGFSNLKLGDVLNGSLQAGSDLELKPSEDTTLSQEQRAISARSADGERLEGSLRLEQKGTSTTGSVNDSEKFDWKKIGRGAILNKLKPPGL
jgi:hypothetical protein